MIGQLRSHVTNRRRVSDNNNISQLLRDSFSESQQPPIWEPPSHYSMSTSLNIVSTSSRVSVPWCLAVEANEWRGVDNDNSIAVIIIATTELWFVISMNIYTLYIRYLHSTFTATRRLVDWNTAIQLPDAGDTDLSVTFIAHPEEYFTFYLHFYVKTK